MTLQSFSSVDISASGMMAERKRMEVIANNIANAYSTRSENGQPYRRQNLVFGAAPLSFDAQLDGSQFGGVKVLGVAPDMTTDFQVVYNPGHPDADAQGMVAMPNVFLPNEMVDMITASRSYEMNLKAMKNYREMAEQLLTLLRG